MQRQLDQVLRDALAVPIGWGAIAPDSVFPRIVLNRVSGTRDYSLDGPGLMRARLQVDCYGEDYPDTYGLSQAVCAALEAYVTRPIQGVFLEAMRDGIGGDATSRLHRITLTFSVNYTEDLPG